MGIHIFQGHEPALKSSYINVVIDVIRAFTVTQYAFMKGAEGILLAGSVEEAFKLKQKNPDYLLAGEVGGLPISGFDFDNSPANVFKADLRNRYLIQKTTNGVTATLNSLDAEYVFVTGFSNARTTAEFIKNKLIGPAPDQLINIIASHPDGDDDLACAEYISGLLHGPRSCTGKEAADRIVNSAAAQKFFDEAKPQFNPEDIDLCIKERSSGFIMKVSYKDRIPMIERVSV
ncbi:2-phosphosulfolactate phosphatase [Peribacillus deserti]|uniref:Probable 2-phosphosulfolactate phosphatase n=1 Tax=Peribacillus deserti TaxID=673318 RepID=A0A2N5M874_9BACI|nr:2-phosphosulfolactate phosphatase [Peribacillus deserti]PLT30547.1 2-phosphosulfolactate phosphatase [Peribacillus deserti]